MRKRIRTNSVAKVVIEQEGKRLETQEARERQLYGWKVRQIMTELNLTWEQGKSRIQRREQWQGQSAEVCKT